MRTWGGQISLPKQKRKIANAEFPESFEPGEEGVCKKLLVFFLACSFNVLCHFGPL